MFLLDNSRCHGGAHIVLVGDAEVGYSADTSGMDIRRRGSIGGGQIAPFYYAGAGGGHRPLRRGRTLGAVFQREAVLPLGGAVVR